MSFGITAQGFNLKTLELILQEIESNQRSLLGGDFDTSSDTPEGQINGIFADHIADLWEALQAVYASRTRDGAEGASLDDLGALLNLPRLEAATSKVTLYLHLDASASVPAGEIVSIGPTGTRWVTTEAVTAGSIPGFYPVKAESEDEGVILGNAYSIDTIVSPVSGWDDKAAVYSANAEPFDLRPFDDLVISIDGGDAQTVTFLEADFASITAATAQEVIDAIEAKVTGLSGDDNGTIKIYSDTSGLGSSIQILGGTANPELGFDTFLVQGMNPNQPATLVCTQSETFNMSTSPTLFVAVDGTTPQPIAFTSDDFGYPARGRIFTVVGASISHGESFTILDGGGGNVQFVFDQTNTFTTTATLYSIAYVGTESAQQMRDLMVAAVNASSLNVSAVGTPEAEEMIVTHNAVGTVGNVNILEAVANSGFTVEGMAYGAASNPTSATAAQIARAINRQAVGFKAFDTLGKVELMSDAVGFNSRLEITGGDANLILGFPLEAETAGINGAAALGRDDETDSAYRLRQEIINGASGNATYDAMRSRLLQVDGVVQAFVFDNPTDFVDAFGRPPHSFEAVVLGGDDADVAQAIFITKPLGIESYAVPGPSGTTVGVINSQGNTIPIGFSRPDTVTMHIEVDILVDATFGNGDQILGEQTVKQAIKDIGDAYNIGQDLVILLLRCAPLAVTGVKDVTAIAVGTVDPPVNTSNIVISERSLAFFSTLNVDVNVTYQ